MTPWDALALGILLVSLGGVALCAASLVLEGWRGWRRWMERT